MLLEDVVAMVKAMPADQQREFIEDAYQATPHMVWVPNPGPQAQAYYSEADVLLFGGAAGGGKSQLTIGLAVQEHQRSIIFRRESSQTDGLEADAKRIIGATAGFNGTDREFTWSDGRSLKLAGMKDADSWIDHAGRERDLIAFDEAGEFLLVQVASVFGWNRGPTGQRCRVVFASNPPRTAEGAWMLEWFAPWIDPKFPNPAANGELRWAILDGDSKTVWVDGPAPVTIKGVQYLPHSRTFIPSRLTDNPYRNTPEYLAKLQMTPEPLRSQLINGDFMAGRKDQEWQVIPTAWVEAAQRRWRAEDGRNFAMTALALDSAGGGEDPAALAARHGPWYAHVETRKGPETQDGSVMASWIVEQRRSAAAVVVDVGGGYGGNVCQRLEDNNIEAHHFNGATKSTATTKDGRLRFANKRAEAYWMFRDELDPDQQGGAVIALPPDPELLADLTAPTWKLGAQGIVIESKVVLGEGGKVIGGLRKRLGRSTNKGDAVVMAWSEGNKAAQRLAARGARGGHAPAVVLQSPVRRRR